MKRRTAKIFFGLFFSCSLLLGTKFSLADQTTATAESTTAKALSAVGYWQTIDDETGKPRSIVKICQLKNNLLYGRVIQVNYNEGEKPTDVCNLCSAKDPRYNQPNLGIIFLTDMKQTFPNIWDDGKVLDPHNGKIYDAKMVLAKDGSTLTMRGYLGISLLGRSQTWNQVTDDQLKTLLGKVPTNSSAAYLTTSTGKYVAQNYDSCDAMQQELDAMTNQSTPEAEG